MRLVQRCKSRRDTATPARSPCGARRALRARRRAPRGSRVDLPRMLPRRRPRHARQRLRARRAAARPAGAGRAARRSRAADCRPIAARLELGGRSEAAGDGRAAPHPADRDGAHRVARSRRVRRPRHDARRSLAARRMPHRSGASTLQRHLEPRFGRPRDAAGSRVAVARARHGQARRRRAQLLVRRRPRIPVSRRCAPATAPQKSSPRRTTCALGQLLIKLLDQATDDGFVYRVDTAPAAVRRERAARRERSARSKRTWSSMAAIGSATRTSRRGCSRGGSSRPRYSTMSSTPFVYRRYLDYGVFDALRQMKRLIAQEVARKDLAENIKLGPGGIREIEFIVQAFQTRARRPQSRRCGRARLLTASAAARRRSAAAAAPVEQLAAARIGSLRTLENRLQAMDDRADARSAGRSRRARAARVRARRADLAELLRAAARQRAIVEAEFERIAWEAEGAQAATTVPLDGAAWQAGDVASDARGDAARRRRATSRRSCSSSAPGGLYQRMDEVG